MKKLKKIIHLVWGLLTSSDIRFWFGAGYGLHNNVPDDEYLCRLYRAIMHKELNLSSPQTFNEKLQWLKLYDRRPEYTMMVDKYRVREYIANTIGEEYLIPLLGVWDSPEDIDFDALPNQFVLKCNHNSGLGMCICKDKSALDVSKVKRELKKGLAQDYYLSGREWPYKDVKRRIIAEQYMVDESGTELKDYKVMCFGGEPKLIQLHQGRFQRHTQDFYDIDWNYMDFEQGCPRSSTVEKPQVLHQMLDLSRELTKGYPQLRVDWYCVSGKLYFGELTVFDGSGFSAFEPEEWDYTLGSWIDLSNAHSRNDEI